MPFDEATFLDRLYSAPFDALQWVPVMEQFADILGSNGAWLSRLSVADGTGAGIIARIDPEKPSVYLAHYAAINPFSNEADPRGYVANWSPKIRFYNDWMPRDAVDRTEYYNDFLRPQDIYCSMMLGLSADGVETCTLSMNRSHAKGDFDAREIALAQRLHPHWRRAFLLSARLQSAHALSADMAAMLDHAQQAMLLVAPDGRVRHANALAAQVISAASGLRMENGRLSATHPPAARQLEALIGRATRTDGTAPEGGSMVVSNSQTGAWLAVSVDPLPDQRDSIFHSGRLAIVCVTNPLATADISEIRLQQMFGFTPAETKVALALLDGASPREISERQGVRYQTVRNQMQALFQKTMTSRQAELVLLLARVAVTEASALPYLSNR